MGRKDKALSPNDIPSSIGGSYLRRARQEKGISLTEMAKRLGYTKGYLSGAENSSKQPSYTLIRSYERELGLKSNKLSKQLRTESTLAPESTSQYFPEPFPLYWNIEHQPNPFFTGREEILASLYNSLRARRAVALSQPLAINGLGGIGKTQTALEYAYRYRGDYKAVLWVSADSQETILSGFLSIAHVLDLPEKDKQNQRDVVAAVQHWLKDHKGWLLILDNVEDLEMILSFIPPASRGHILLTTRLQALGRTAQGIEIESMTPEEGALFLLRRAKIISLDASLDSVSNKDRESALAITIVVDGLPLALDQAGAYIEETRCGLTYYLNLYDNLRSDLLNRRGEIVFDHPQSVMTTFSLSLEKVHQTNSNAVELLRFCAFLYPDAIPEEIITKNSLSLDPMLQSLASHPISYDEAIGELLKYSLIRRDANNRILTVHRLVQAVLKDEMNSDTQRLWAERAIQAVDHIFPFVDVETWPTCQRCLPHAQVCAAFIEQWDIKSEEGAELLNRAGYYLQVRAQYKEAEQFHLRALMIREEILGPEHPDTAIVLNNLATLYDKQRKYSEAEPLYLRALAIRTKMLGPEHPVTATSLNDLAKLYREQRRYPEAESLYLQALRIYEQSLGLEHPDTATVLNNLARLYLNQEKYTLVEPLLQRSLAINEKIQGPYHLDTANSLTHLARLYKRQGKYSEAEQLYQRALAIREEVLGPKHPDTATILSSLAKLYDKQDRYSEAEQLYQRALAIREEVFGPEHPRVTATLEDLTDLLQKTDRKKYNS